MKKGNARPSWPGIPLDFRCVVSVAVQFILVSSVEPLPISWSA